MGNFNFNNAASKMVCSLLLASSVTEKTAYGAPPGNSPVRSEQSSAKQTEGTQSIQKWFRSYEKILQRAQLTEDEQIQAERLEALPILLWTPSDLNQLKITLTDLAKKYQKAKQEMSALPASLATDWLKESYQSYFEAAFELCMDGVRLSDYLFVRDPSTGQTVLTLLTERKKLLEQLACECKQIEHLTRIDLKVRMNRELSAKPKQIRSRERPLP